MLKRIYPDIAQLSGTFWQKSSPAIDHWNGVIEYFCNFAKYCQPHAKSERNMYSQKVVSKKNQVLARYLVKPTVVANTRVWSFIMEKL